MLDPAVIRAGDLIRAASHGSAPTVRGFFDPSSNTVSYVVHDPVTARAAMIDSVLDFDPASGRTATRSADLMIAYADSLGLGIDWLLETHAHADHLSAAPYLQARMGGRLAIGREIVAVQTAFGALFNIAGAVDRDGADFDHLFDDGDEFQIGALNGIALHVPGHTPADMAYVIGDAVFVGDTVFMPDHGTARADFPGGDPVRLFRSIRRLLSLPDQTRVFLCHDYPVAGRDQVAWETTIAAERAENVHIREGVNEKAFVAMRRRRDAALAMPRLLLPSVQVNLRGGRLPDPEPNGTRYLKLPLDVF